MYKVGFKISLIAILFATDVFAMETPDNEEQKSSNISYKQRGSEDVSLSNQSLYPV